MVDYLKNIIKEICLEKNIDSKSLSKDWILRLERESKNGYIVGNRFSINSITASSIASDKYATYEVLKNANIPIIEHNMIFNPKFRKGCISDFKNKNEIKNYYKTHNNKLIIKANEGSCGRDVYLCKTVHEIFKYMKKIFKNKASASICPFYEIDTEYRVIILDNECKLIYGKKAKEGSWKHNLSQGALAVEVNDDALKNTLIEIAQKSVKEIGLRFASVDIIKIVTGELLVIEVNSNVTINKYTDFVQNGREIAKKIYGEAIEKMLG